MGERKNDDLQVGFDGRLKLRFYGSRVTSDAGLLAYHELEKALGLIQMGEDILTDFRLGPASKRGSNRCVKRLYPPIQMT